MIYCYIKNNQILSKYFFVFLAISLSFFIQFLFSNKCYASDKYAFIISIDKYKRLDLAPIEKTKRDAGRLRSFLTRQGYRTDHLRGPNATKSNIYKQFKRFIEIPKPQDTVIIYFIGYGSGNSLLAYDADRFGSNSISLDSLVYLSSSIRKGKTIYIIDACLNGQLDKLAYQRYDNKNAIMILSKCAAKTKQPTFTTTLLRGIKYRGRHKPIYLSDLLYIVEKANIANVHYVVKHEEHDNILISERRKPQMAMEMAKKASRPSLRKFPWPPPRASAKAVVPSQHLKPTNKIVHYDYINRVIVSALNKCGYGEKSYFAVPNGFALVTQLEQINEDGTSKSKQERWSVDVQPLRDFSLAGYFKALFTAKRGYFRIIVFIVTDQPFFQKESTVSKAQALDWLWSGYNKLPKDLGKLIYSKDHTTTALIYEFIQPGHKKKGTLKFPGRFTGQEHLIKSNILFALGR